MKSKKNYSRCTTSTMARVLLGKTAELNNDGIGMGLMICP